MQTCERRTTIGAPLEDVWQFHSRTEGLEALTPEWMGLRVEGSIGPDGDPDPEGLAAETEISLSLRPFGVGPRQYWTSVITARERTDERAVFRDELVHGPFDHWVHTHSFVADGERTHLRDQVDYELPYSRVPGIGQLVSVVSPLSALGFEAMVRTRHRLTKTHFECVRHNAVGVR